MNSKKKIKWSSSNSKIAKVSSKGVVTAISAGKVKIYAKMAGKKYKCSVTVVKKPDNIAPSSDPQNESTNENHTQPAPAPSVNPGKTEDPKDDDKSDVPKNKAEVVYKDGILTDTLKEQTEYTILDADADDCYVVMPLNDITENIEVDQIITLPNADGTPYALLKVIETHTEDKEVLLHCVTPDLTEVFEKVDIYQDRSIPLENLDFNEELVSNITILNNENDIAADTKNYNVPNKDYTGELEAAVIDFGEKEIGKYGKLSGKIELEEPVLHVNMDIDVNDDYTVDIHSLEATVSEKVTSMVDLSFDTDEEFEKIFLAHARMPIVDVPIFADFTLYLNISASGEIKIVNETSYTGGFTYDGKEDNLKEINDFNTSFEGTEAQVSGAFLLNPQVRISCLSDWDEKDKEVKGIELLGIEVNAGIGMDGYVKVYSDEPYVCADLHIYPLLELGLIEKYGVQRLIQLVNKIPLIKIKTHWTVLDNETSSKFEKTWHWEDMTKVEKCTRKDGGSVSGNNPDSVSSNTIDTTGMEIGEQTKVVEDSFKFLTADIHNLVKENQFTISEAGKIILDGNYEGAPLYWHLIDENGNVIEYQESSTGIVHDSLYIKAGTYRFRCGISAYSLEDGSRGSYTLTYESSGITNQAADNVDMARQLESIAWNKEVLSQFSENRRELYYNVKLTESGRLHIWGEDENSAGRYDLYDNSGNNIGVSGLMSQDGYEAWYDLEAGDYCLVFSGDSERFSFTLDCKKSGETYTDFNNTIAAAEKLNPVPYDKNIKGQIAYNDSKDYFRIEVPKAGTLYIMLASQSRTKIDMELYDESGERCDLDGEKSNYMDNTKSVIAYKKVLPGVYYLLCDGENGNYSFKLHLK